MLSIPALLVLLLMIVIEGRLAMNYRSRDINAEVRMSNDEERR